VHAFMDESKSTGQFSLTQLSWPGKHVQLSNVLTQVS
jgi:hypothetical protein